MIYEKQFAQWHSVKEAINNKALPTFKEAEVWWCSVGVNVSHEIDGKGDQFLRPVLILRKFNKTLFFGIPLTTAKKKPNIQYYAFTFNGKPQYALLAQAKSFDAVRLTQKMGKLGETDFENIKSALIPFPRMKRG